MNNARIRKVAEKIVAKWLRKGNMARAMRDVLPSSGLTQEERDLVAEIVHHVVRFKKLYDFALEREGLGKNPKNYVNLFFQTGTLEKYANMAVREGREDVYLSASPQVLRVLRMFPKFASIINREPETHLSVNLPRISRRDALKELRKEGVEAHPCTPETCVRSEPRARYSHLVKEGLAIVQDSSSQHLSKLVATLGDDILDYCAGSGGKSFTAKFFNPRARICIHDINEKKIESLFRRAELLGLEFEEFRGEEHEVLLVDAPCSGLGSSARNPEAKYREDLDEFPNIQMDILREAKEFVKPGGFLIYAVCTFNPDETYLLVEKFLEENPDFGEMEMGGGDFFEKERIGGYFVSGDVIYAAVLRRKGD